MMRLKICRTYFVQNLENWLSEKKRSCEACRLVSREKMQPMRAALLPEKKLLVWQVDYIGQFPPDSETGDW